MNPIPPRSFSHYAFQYRGGTDFTRLFQIFSESGKLAVESKNPETASSRFHLAVEAYHQLMSLPISPDVRGNVQNAMAVLADVYPGQVCMNEAIGLCERARKLKSVRKQLEYLQRARSVLETRLFLEGAGQDGVRSIHSQVMTHIASGEALLTSSKESREEGRT